jgi:hypothetical protein
MWLVPAVDLLDVLHSKMKTSLSFVGIPGLEFTWMCIKVTHMHLSLVLKTGMFDANWLNWFRRVSC